MQSQMFFTGESITRKRVSLRGRSPKEMDRDALIKNAQLERGHRLKSRKKSAAALTIQGVAAPLGSLIWDTWGRGSRWHFPLEQGMRWIPSWKRLPTYSSLNTLYQIFPEKAKDRRFKSPFLVQTLELSAFGYLQKCFRARRAVKAAHSLVREQFYGNYARHCKNVDRHCFGPDSGFFRQLCFFFNAKDVDDFSVLVETCRLLQHFVQDSGTFHQYLQKELSNE
ncbi:hypothetical protein SLEP1_g38432 [Rubroshorea leprosula]|nr:hypothetical protein SLEP1_g38432 [Rubroshorea leprosula]